MLYKLVTHYYLYNNAFAFLQKDERGITGIYPVGAVNVEFITDTAGVMYCRFYFRNGRSVILPYSDIIHLRRNFNDNDLLGDPNSALMPALELAHTRTRAL